MTLDTENAQLLCQKFWTTFCKIIGTGHLIYPAHNEGGLRFLRETINSSTKRVWLENPICLQSWPCKGHPSNTVDIVICYEMTVTVGAQIPRCRIVESKAQVVYFLGGVRANPLEVQVFRFDYHPRTGLSEGDPLFHLQLGDKKLITKALLPPPLRKSWTRPQHHVSAPGSHVRVPTARMLLPDVLCYLVADHLRGEVHDLVDKTRPTVTHLTDLVTDIAIAEKRFYQFTTATKWYRR
jgi:hypothetical protein